MFLRKIRQSNFFQIYYSYYIWVAYILLIFLSTNAYSSLDLIKNYRFTWDMLLTYGFLAFLINLEALFFALIIAIIQTLLMKMLRVDVSVVMRIFLILCLILSLVNLALMAFDKAII